MTTTSPLDADYTAARQRHTFKHVGYVVDDIAQAVSHWVEALGAGPFFLIDSVTFDDLDYSGGPAVYEHSIAFGRWGPITVELMEFQRIEPESLAARMATPPNRPNHIGYSVSDIHLERARLEALGAETFLTARTGDVEGVVLHVPWLGHSVELLADSDFIRAFADTLSTATDGWDGRDQLRALDR